MPTGACIPPASLASRTSRGGSAASRVTSSAPIARSPRTPPVIRTTLAYGRVASRTALAVPASSVPNAIAVGPMSSGLSAVADRILGGDPHQPVLDDAIRHVLLAQGAPDLGDLLDLEAAVLGDDHRPGVRRVPRAARRRSPVWPPWACGTSCPSARGRRAAVGPDRIDRVAPATSLATFRREGRPQLAGALPTRRWSGTGLPRRARRRPRSPTLAGRAAGPVRRIKPRPSPPDGRAAVRERRLSAAVRLSLVR